MARVLISMPEEFLNRIDDIIVFHQLTKDDIKNIDGIIVTTEKDAVKLATLGYTETYALKLKIDIDTKKILE